jgi:hypothetical protein
MVRLRNISHQLAKFETQAITDLFELTVDPEFKAKKDKEFNLLLKFAKGNPKIKEMMDLYGADDKIMRKVYDQLILHGAGKFTRGYWVAAASLTDPNTLEALFKYFDGEKFILSGHTDYNSGIKVAYRMFTYFTEGENGPIEEI